MKGLRTRSRSGSFLRSLRWQIPLLPFFGLFWLIAVHRFILPMLLNDLDRELFRDSALALTSTYFQARDEGKSPEESLRSLQIQASRFLQDPVIFRFDKDGLLQDFSGACHPVRTKLPDDVRQAISGPVIYYGERRPFALCEEQQSILSLYAFSSESEKGILALSSRVPPFQSRSWALLLSWPMLGVFLASVILLALWSRWVFSTFQTHLLGTLRGLNEQARRFVDGDYSASVAGGDLQEIEEIAQGFNRLARVNEERIRTLQDDNRERRELLAGFAHDLRTPMTAMEGSVHLLGKETLAESQRSRFSAILRGNLESQSKLLEQLSALKELEDPSQEFLLENVNLEELLIRLKSLIEPTANLRGVNVSMGSVPAALSTGTFLVHRISLQRGLLNLLENAIRATPEGGTVDLGVSAEPRRLTFLVQNPYVVLEGSQASEPQIDQGPLKLRRKTGIGLGVVKRVAALHQGELIFDRETEGVFRVRLWISTELQSPLQPARVFEHPSVESQPEGIRILSQTSRRMLEILGGLAGVCGCLLMSASSARLAWVGSLLLYFLAGRFSGSGEFRRELFGNLLRAVSLLVFFFVIFYAPPEGLRFFQGWYLSASVCVFAFVAKRDLRSWAFVLSLLIAPLLMLRIPGMLSVGEVFGLLTSGFMAGLGDSEVGRRTRVWFSSLFSFALFASMGAFGAASYRGSQRIIDEISASQAHVFESSLRGETFANREQLESRLVDAWRIAPLVDFVFLEDHGGNEVVLGSARGGDERPAFQARDIPLSARCADESCPRMKVLIPGRLAHDVFHRAGAGWLFDIILFQIVGVFAIVTAFSRSWAAQLSRQILKIRKGIAEFQKGNSLAKIHLAPDAEGYVLSKSLETLVRRCHEVEALIQEKRVEFSTFLGTAERALLASHSDVTALLERQEEVNLGSAVQRLRGCVEAVFELALVQRADMESGEEFSLSDLLEEELENVRASSGGAFASEFEDGLMIVRAPVEFVLFALRYVLRKIIEGRKEDSRSTLRVYQGETGICAEFSFIGEENHALISQDSASLDALIWTYLQKQFIRFHAEIHLKQNADGLSIFLLKFNH